MGTPRVAIIALLASASLAGCEPPPPPAPPPPAPAPPPPPAPEPSEPSPCLQPEPVQLKIKAGGTATTPHGLEIDYRPGVGRVKGLRSFEFTLRHGERRWRVERTMANWNKRMTWRGFCWKGGDPPPKAGANRVVVHVAPVCDESGKLLEMGGCRDVLK